MHAEQLVRAVAEKVFRLRVHEDDSGFAIRDEYSLGRGIEHRSGRSITERRSSLRHNSFR